MNHSYIDFTSLLFFVLLYTLLCLCTVDSLLPCVSSDNELKFRCGVLQFGSLSFITWNPSTLRFHKKTKQKKKKNTTTTKQEQKRKHLNEGWSSQLYTQLLQLGKRKPEKDSGLYGIRTFDLCDTGAALYQLNCRGRGNESRTSRNFFFSGFLFATAKVAYMRTHNMIFIYSKLHLKNSHRFYY